MRAERRLRAPVLLALIFAGAAAFYWTGLGPGDAEHYIDAALRWREGSWLGDTHWALRHLFVLPMAAAFHVFGPSEFAATLPNIIFAALTVAITFVFARRVLGEREAFIAAALIATSAFFIARPLELDVYGAEAFFAALATWLFIAAREGEDRRFLFAAGVTVGLAFAVREQAACLLVAFGLLLIRSRKDLLPSLLFLGAGFGVVIAAELLLYAFAASDPFYRYRIDLGHRDLGVGAALTPEQTRLLARAGRAAKFLVTTPATTPMLLLAAASALHLRRAQPPLADKQESALSVFATVAIVSAILTPLAFNLAWTRYYPILTYAAFLVVATAIARLWAADARKMAAASIAAVVVVNLAAADFTRDGDYAEARALAWLAKDSAEPIYADALTVQRARYQLRLSGWTMPDASAKVRNIREARAGSLVFKTGRTPSPEGPACVTQALQIRTTGWTHAILRSSGIAKARGGRLGEIAAEPAPVTILRLLEAPSRVDPVSGQPCVPEALQDPD